MYRTLPISFLAQLAMLCVGLTGPLAAAEGTTEPPEADAIRAAAKQYLKAKQKGDRDAVRKAWTRDGDYINALGQVFQPHQSLDQPRSAGQSTEQPADADSSQSTVRFITPDVAIEDGLIDADAAAPSPGRYSAVWVKRDGRWLLDSVRESATLPAPASSRLQSLAWLVGEWAAKNGEAAMLISARWSDGGHYIVRDFLVHRPGIEPISATQRIGWDPRSQKIKSWSFDSQGGAGEAFWRRDGKRWVVDSTDVTADGKSANTTSAYIPSGADRFVWEVTRAHVDGEQLPPHRIEFKRAANDE